MTRLIDWIHQELHTFDAVMRYRSRSFYIFVAALPSGLALQLLLASILSQTTAIPGLAEAMHLWPALFGLGLTLKFLFLAIQVYLKDRARLLRL